MLYMYIKETITCTVHTLNAHNLYIIRIPVIAEKTSTDIQVKGKNPSCSGYKSAKYHYIPHGLI